MWGRRLIGPAIVLVVMVSILPGWEIIFEVGCFKDSRLESLAEK